MPDRDYRNLQLASTTHFVSPWGATNLTLAYMDHPFGADQFYGTYPSWEDTKTWFAGISQAIGKKTSASFAYRRHSDLFVLFRDQPAIYTNHHSDESYQTANPSSATTWGTTRAAVPPPMWPSISARSSASRCRSPRERNSTAIFPRRSAPRLLPDTGSLRT
jgi:hypothetical protein